MKPISKAFQLPYQARFHTVSSRHNARVKELRRLFHAARPNQSGEVAVEGIHLVEEAIRSGLRISTVFVSESARERVHKLLPQLSQHAQVLLLSDNIFSSAVLTETPQGIAALVRVKACPFSEVIRGQPSLIVIAAGVQDPGNLGTIARSAEAFEATGMIVAENTVSPWNWKALRASAGSLFRLPWANSEMASVVPELKKREILLLATSSHRGNTISESDLKRPLALLIGNEGAGLPKNILAQADEVMAIPHSNRVESLNAGIAASVVLYEAARQRSQV